MDSTGRILLINLLDDDAPEHYVLTRQAGERLAAKIGWTNYAVIFEDKDGERRTLVKCDPYQGDDDRALQGMGLPNASECSEDYQLDASQAGEDW
jgi:hypothetical protein